MNDWSFVEDVREDSSVLMSLHYCFVSVFVHIINSDLLSFTRHLLTMLQVFLVLGYIIINDKDVSNRYSEYFIKYSSVVLWLSIELYIFDVALDNNKPVLFLFC